MMKSKTYPVFPERQCWGLHRKGDIVFIHSWSEGIIPRELHFKFKRKSKWAFDHDFDAFGNTKRSLRCAKRKQEVK